MLFAFGEIIPLVAYLINTKLCTKIPKNCKNTENINILYVECNNCLVFNSIEHIITANIINEYVIQ